MGLPIILKPYIEVPVEKPYDEPAGGSDPDVNQPMPDNVDPDTGQERDYIGYSGPIKTRKVKVSDYDKQEPNTRNYLTQQGITNDNINQYEYITLANGNRVYTGGTDGPRVVNQEGKIISRISGSAYDYLVRQLTEDSIRAGQFYYIEAYKHSAGIPESQDVSLEEAEEGRLRFEIRKQMPDDVRESPLNVRKAYEEVVFVKSTGKGNYESAEKKYDDALRNAGLISTPQPEKEHTDVWKLSSWKKDFWGTLGGGVADFLHPMSDDIANDIFVGGIYRKITGDNRTDAQKWKQNREAWEYLWDEQDYGGMGLRALDTSIATIVGSYGFGKLMGGISATKWGGTKVFTSKAVWGSGSKVGQPIINITRAKAIEIGIGAGGTALTVKGGVEAYEKDKLKEFGINLAVALPLSYGFYKAGYKSGMGYVQRKSGMSKVSGYDRTRQQGLYDAMDVVSSMKDRPEVIEPFNLTDIERIDINSAMRVRDFLYSERNRFVFSSRPKIGGSTSSYMQMPEGLFRTDSMPSGLRDWAVYRQSLSSTSPNKPLIGRSMPGDIDLLVRDVWGSGGLSRAKSLYEPHVFDVHAYKTGMYRGFGVSQLEPTWSSVYDPNFFKTGEINIPMKVRTLSLREQFLRKTTTILPSETVENAYRSYKDIPDWYDVGDYLGHQGGGTKLWNAMDKVINPQKYSIPKVTLGERFIARIGGAVEPKWVETPGGMYNLPVYPKNVITPYPAYTITGGGYPISPYNNYTYNIKPSSYTFKPTSSLYKTPSPQIINPPKLISYKTPSPLNVKPVKPVRYPTPVQSYVFSPKPPVVSPPPPSTYIPPVLPPPIITTSKKTSKQIFLDDTGKYKNYMEGFIDFKKTKYRFRMFKIKNPLQKGGGIF